MTTQQLERRVRLLTAYAAGSTLLFLVLLLGAFGYARQERFETIDVERINVIEPDGQFAVVISNGQRIPGVVVGGEELPKELSQGRIGAAGLVFFNGKGDEAGGLIYRSEKTDSGYTAFSGLTFDQYNQDEVVTLSYLDRGSGRSAGLDVWDRPTDFTTEETVDLIMARQQATGAERDSVQQLIDEAAERGDLGTRRMFVGNEDRTAAIRMSDTEGRMRIRMYVDSSDVARLEFLDEEGDVVYAIPE